MDTTTTIISSSYKIQRDVQLSAGGNPPSIGFVLLSLILEFFNQSDTRVDPITIFSLNSVIKMFYEVSFASSNIFPFLAIITNHYHRFDCNIQSNPD